MLIVKLNNINFRFGNLIKVIIGVITANLFLYKHNKICIKEVKEIRECIILSKFPDYYIFDEFTINDDKIIESDFFDGFNYIFNLSSNDFDYLLNKYLKPYINYDVKLNSNINFNEDLFIHIRSGDVFDKNDVFVNGDINSPIFKWFIQPPYSFYEKIIKENMNRKIYILSENKNNPIIEKIMNHFQNCTFLSNDFETDFSVLLKSKYLVSSTSDFVLSAVILSNDKNIIYASRPNYYIMVSHKFHIKYYDYSEYYNTKINSYDEKIYLMLNS